MHVASCVLLILWKQNRSLQCTDWAVYVFLCQPLLHSYYLAQLLHSVLVIQRLQPWSLRSLIRVFWDSSHEFQMSCLFVHLYVFLWELFPNHALVESSQHSSWSAILKIKWVVQTLLACLLEYGWLRLEIFGSGRLAVLQIIACPIVDRESDHIFWVRRRHEDIVNVVNVVGASCFDEASLEPSQLLDFPFLSLIHYSIH